MSQPRPVYPQQTYMITRRVVGRMFRLNPSKRVNQAFLYLLGFCAQRYGIDLFALTVMSNHYHLVARDNDALYPNFLRDFNALLARCINAAFGMPTPSGLGPNPRSSALAMPNPCSSASSTR